MEPRRLKAIMNLPVAKRFDLIAEGLDSLVRHVSNLYEDAKHLEALGRPRGAEVIEAFVEEEAAKVLILLDLVRTDPKDTAAWSSQIPRFYSHLARCLYARAYQGSPADLAEVRNHLDRLRKSHYLDGPNDIDWIFRNEPVARREQILYVDLVESEDELVWWGPSDDSFCWVSSRLPDLMTALSVTGITTRQGLDLVSETWAPVLIDDGMPWWRTRELNEQVLQAAYENGLLDAETTEDHYGSVLNDWIFPLRTLDLTENKVNVDLLKERRKKMLEQRYYEEFGSPW